MAAQLVELEQLEEGDPGVPCNCAASWEQAEQAKQAEQVVVRRRWLPLRRLQIRTLPKALLPSSRWLRCLQNRRRLVLIRLHRHRHRLRRGWPGLVQVLCQTGAGLGSLTPFFLLPLPREHQADVFAQHNVTGLERELSGVAQRCASAEHHVQFDPE